MQIVLPGITGSGELWLDIMKIICGTEHDHPFSSMCDLMCHKAPYTPRLGFAYRTYVDIQDRELEYEWQRPYFKNMDVFDFLRNSCNIKYDVMICSDGIEHLYFDKGTELLSLMEEHSNKQIIFTPLGPYMLSEDDNPDSHKRMVPRNAPRLFIHRIA